MRRPFEKLVLMLERECDANPKVTMGELAAKYHESIDRIYDAMDGIKMMRGQPSYMPYPGNDLEGHPL